MNNKRTSRRITAVAATALRSRIAGLCDIARRDGSVMVGANVTTLLVRLVGTIILTRILDAAAFGMVGIMTSVSTAVMLLSNLGFFSYIVRDKRAADPAFLDKLWSIRVVRGFFQTCFVWAIAYPLALFLGKPEAFWVICTAGLLLFLESVNSLVFATATVDGQLKRLILVETCLVVVQLVASVLLALIWPSYLAIIVAIVTTAVLRAIASFAAFRNAHRKWDYDGAEARRLWTFGRFIAASSSIEFLISQSDKFVLAKLFSISIFGLYILAASLADIPNTIIANYVQRIIYPILTQARERTTDEIADLLYASGKKLRILYMMACGGLIAGAPFVVELLYDNRYRGAALFLQILAVGAVFKLPVAIANEYLIAIGKVHHSLIINLVRLSALILFGVLGYLNYGPTGVVFAIVATQITAYLYCMAAQWRGGHFRMAPEIGYLGLATVGFAIGWPINMFLLALVRS